MAKRTTPAQPEDRELTRAEIHLAMRRLQRRVSDVEAFDPTKVRSQQDPNIRALEAAIKETLAEIFGPNSRTYRSYSAAAALDTAGINMNGTPLHEVIEGLVHGKERSLVLLQQAIRSFEEKLEDLTGETDTGFIFAEPSRPSFSGAEARAEAGGFNIQGGDASFTVRRAATTIVTAVRSNQAALQLAALSLLASLDAKLEQLRADRSNSDDPAQYEDLKRRVEEFLAASSSNDEAPIVATTLSLADGLRAWWTKDHSGICNRAFNIGLFAGGLSICAAAGALGPVSVVTVGTLIAGKNIAKALEACVKLLKSDGQ
jgi:hypothetical protein